MGLPGAPRQRARSAPPHGEGSRLLHRHLGKRGVRVRWMDVFSLPSSTAHPPPHLFRWRYRHHRYADVCSGVLYLCMTSVMVTTQRASVCAATASCKLGRCSRCNYVWIKLYRDGKLVGRQEHWWKGSTQCVAYAQSDRL